MPLAIGGYWCFVHRPTAPARFRRPLNSILAERVQASTVWKVTRVSGDIAMYLCDKPAGGVQAVCIGGLLCTMKGAERVKWQPPAVQNRVPVTGSDSRHVQSLPMGGFSGIT